MPRRRPLPGAIELLRHLHGTRVKFGIATSGRSQDAKPSLDALELPDDAVIVDRNDVERAKPEPDLFLAAQEQLSVRPEECYVIGDAVWDLLAARRAGMLGIGLLSGGYGQKSWTARAPTASTAIPPNSWPPSTSSAFGRPEPESRVARPGVERKSALDEVSMSSCPRSRWRSRSCSLPAPPRRSSRSRGRIKPRGRSPRVRSSAACRKGRRRPSRCALTVKDAVQRALQNNLGLLLQEENASRPRTARAGARWPTCCPTCRARCRAAAGAQPRGVRLPRAQSDRRPVQRLRRARRRCRSRSSTSRRSTSRAPPTLHHRRRSTASRPRAISSCWSR